MVDIPRELVTFAAERRLIPFVGAGFSAALKLPTWETMLRELCDQLEDSIPFDDLLEFTGRDYLQIAEYLFLKYDRQIGPIRRQLERSLSNHESPLLSGPHVELLNLEAGQIYTTNYDDLIETTYRGLKRKISPVILPKDVALSDTERTQIVKFHGDLTHERTLVLTESAYYKRLDFESPMDLKFRSDLLGKSVLFMGYSFRDVNIRIIWFKLMEMMRDIPEADRRPSYIVRLDPNPALDELNAAVGLKTIILNPNGPVADPAERVRLMGDFLLDLSTQAAKLRENSEGSQDVVSAALLARINKIDEEISASYPKSIGWSLSRFFRPIDEIWVNRLLSGEVPEPLTAQWREHLERALPLIAPQSANTLERLVDRLGKSQAVTDYIVVLLSTQGDNEARIIKSELISKKRLWSHIWASEPSLEVLDLALKNFADEIRYQAQRGADEDIAYLAEVVARIDKGLMGENLPERIIELADSLLKEASRIYSSISTLQPDRESPPNVGAVLEEVAKRAENFEPAQVRLRTDGPRAVGPKRKPVRG